jgi:hypothetical protein
LARSSSEPAQRAAAGPSDGETRPAARRRALALRWLDLAALLGIALGFCLCFHPWGGTLRSGFFLTAVATTLHIVTSHVRTPGDA